MKNVQLMSEGKVLQFENCPAMESAGKERPDRTHVLEHARDITGAGQKKF
jgi:hypothetical protein